MCTGGTTGNAVLVFLRDGKRQWADSDISASVGGEETSFEPMLPGMRYRGILCHQIGV